MGRCILGERKRCVCVLFNLISFTYEQEQDGIPRQKQNNNHKKIEIVRALKL